MYANSTQSFYIYVDVDDTLIRSFGSKRIPIPRIIRHVQELKSQGAILYCWSSGGGDYARRTAEELGIAEIFTAFLPKPHMLLDDQDINNWTQFIQVHPNSCNSKTLETYQQTLSSRS
ncbi:DUF705 domain-containing protein [Roseofilum sp. Guam]|uniref:DUF705 domain-containing protein n=1 Tax=Roseofilum sp. Guam TaxID=2821502 RepID=UPI00298E1460|nr:DUF705 domain-containing protein [Roseofilum sp. Guam]